MPDLTNIACPTCGLPAELVERSDTVASARCILLHDFTIPVVALDVRTPEAAPVAGVLKFPGPRVSGRPEWARRMAWFAFGALAALLLTQAPVAALVLIPLSLPLIGVEAARKSWRPLDPRAQAVQMPAADPGDPQRKAA